MVGAARPSDLDEHVEAAMQLGNAGALVKDIQERLYAFVEDRNVIPYDTPDSLVFAADGPFAPSSLYRGSRLC